MKPDWKTLQRLRHGFLEGTAGDADYWQSPADLEQYDATFAQRIGWKWDFVLNDLADLGWTPPSGNIVDWGCGSGIAGRAFLDHFGRTEPTRLWLSDRSSLAVRFASERARATHPELRLERGVPDRVSLLLVSHVITELSPPQIEQLVGLAATAEAVIWVEPGTYEASLTLIAIRERLRSELQPIAPCTHLNRCGILAPENKPHWCHFFARPPGEIFVDGFWTRFGREMEIDLRSLPLSYLVMDRRPPAVTVENTNRVLGRPNIFKPYAEILACSGCGVCRVKLMKRTHPEAYRQLKKGRCPSRVRLATMQDHITEWHD